MIYDRFDCRDSYSLQSRHILGAQVHISVSGRHLGFSNCGGLVRGDIAEGVGVKWKNGQGGHISGRVVMRY